MGVAAVVLGVRSELQQSRSVNGLATTGVRELTNGLLAGDHSAEDRPFHPACGPIILAVRAKQAGRAAINHQIVAELNKLLSTVLVDVRVGDAIVFTGHVGEESPGLTFVARTHATTSLRPRPPRPGPRARPPPVSARFSSCVAGSPPIRICTSIRERGSRTRPPSGEVAAQRLPLYAHAATARAAGGWGLLALRSGVSAVGRRGPRQCRRVGAISPTLG